MSSVRDFSRIILLSMELARGDLSDVPFGNTFVTPRQRDLVSRARRNGPPGRAHASKRDLDRHLLPNCEERGGHEEKDLLQLACPRGLGSCFFRAAPVVHSRIEPKQPRFLSANKG